MITSSFAAGAPLGLQFASVVQVPPVVGTQVFVAAETELEITSKINKHATVVAGKRKTLVFIFFIFMISEEIGFNVDQVFVRHKSINIFQQLGF